MTIKLSKDKLGQAYRKQEYGRFSIYFGDDHILVTNKLNLWWYPFVLIGAVLTYMYVDTTLGVIFIIGAIVTFIKIWMDNPCFDKRFAIYKNGDVKALTFYNGIAKRKPIGEIQKIELVLRGANQSESSSKPVYDLAIMGKGRYFPVVQLSVEQESFFDESIEHLREFFNCKHESKADDSEVPFTYKY
ncbi:hypothetical protein ACMXYN_08965 [Neptuniibacter sp. PT8_73]|uniref:hypothetical protein n=1 Tax=Neptuniibacter sp. PT8_73 TaxID=3398206 RepID=UPI0039F5783B